MKNVILLTVDALRRDVLGCYGNKEGLTPFMDSLQDKCIKFTNAQSTGPYTQASFPGILTSSYYGEEECYDLNNDPQEQNNLLQKTDKEKLITIRKKMNVFLKTEVASKKEFSQKEKEVINQRLRALGYIE